MNLAIKVPNELGEKVLSFPFLHKLVKELQKKFEEELEGEVLNLHLLSTNKSIDVLNLLPFHAYYHELDEADLKSVFTVHRACTNLLVENIDIYLSLTESFVDASIGKNLKAKKNIGFNISKNNFFLNQKNILNSQEHFSKRLFTHWPSFFGKGEGEVPSVCSRELTPFVPNWNEEAYFIVDLTIKNNFIDEEWKELIDLFEHKKLYLMCSELEPDLQSSMVTDFIKTLSKSNQYVFFEYKSHIDFSKLTAYSKAFISENSGLIKLASYVGAYSFYLNKTSETKLKDCRFFYGEVENFVKEGSIFNYAKIFDRIYAYIDSVIKDTSE